MNRVEATKLAEQLVSRMTVEEKASQLRYDAPAVPRLNIPEYNWWNEALHGVARAGTATVFPQAIGLAAMFDQEGLEEIADTIATEGRARYNMLSALGDRDIFKGLTFWSPNINIFRDPRWGRGQETYGEDPYLTSRLGVAFVKGLQGEGEYLKSAACAKHYAVHSGPEALRHQFDALTNEKDLRETYLPAFEALVKEEKAEAVMGAYNRVNGEPCCGSPTLLVDILRDEWGFEGHVVSDCWAIVDFHKHHMVTSTAPQSAALAIENGCDLNCGNTYLHLLTALQEGLIDEGLIHRAAVRLFATRYLLGLFDENCAFHKINPLENDSETHADLALRAAENSMVLLHNDGLLPLDMDSIKTVAVVGPAADSHSVLEGNYNGTSSQYTTMLEGVRKAFDGRARVIYAEGAKLSRPKDSVLSQYKNDRLQEAVWAAGQADVTILCVGLDATLEGEEGDMGNVYFSGDKENLAFPPSQQPLIDAMKKHARKLVIVVTSGSALNITGGNAILWANYPGQAGGEAMMNILSGKVSPSGKLPITFYHSAEDLPQFTDYSMKNRTYRYYEGEALYPFGYGLSYVDFDYSNVDFDGRVLAADVENTGDMDAAEIVQVYVKGESSFAPLHPRLCAFERINLAPGEKKRVELALDPDAFMVFNDAGLKVSGGQSFTLYVGGSQPDKRSEELTGQEVQRLTYTKEN
ncbi:MAG: glycoside hydrolase family 3 protein [Clostridiales bacterium]|nr:glycoside hydrolase family 3 protein [Clostridiales bacterium]